MDPTIEKLISVGMVERQGLAMQDHTTALGRARDTALHGLKVVEAVVAKELLVSDDPGDFARNNAASRNPSTLDHPNAVVTK